MAEKEKNEWAEKLAYAPKNGYERLSAEEEQAMHAYCEDYKDFLDHGKTERLCVEHCIELASARGFVPYEKGMLMKLVHERCQIIREQYVEGGLLVTAKAGARMAATLKPYEVEE